MNTIDLKLMELYKLNGNQGASKEAALKADDVKGEPKTPEH